MELNLELDLTGLGKAITLFHKLLPEVEENFKDKDYHDFDMEASHVDLSCGTPLCFAGWYAVAKHKFDHENIKETLRLDDMDLQKPGIFKRGSLYFANDLGFEHSWDLISFFKYRNELWGNSKANWMFADVVAFGEFLSEPIRSLRNIVEFLERVHKRCSEARTLKAVI